MGVPPGTSIGLLIDSTMTTSNPNWFPGGNLNTQRPQTAPAYPRQPSSPPLPISQSLSETSSASSSSATTENDGKKYVPPLSEWKKRGKPPENCWWTDSDGRAAAWRCRSVDPRKPQIRGWARSKGDWNPMNHRAWLDAGIEETDTKWKDYPPLPDLKAIEEENRKKKKEEETRKAEKERKKKAEKKRKEKQKEKFVKLPWFMKAMGLKVAKVEVKKIATATRS